MKKKMKNIKKKKTKIKKDKSTFPIELFREDYFKCPIWFTKESGTWSSIGNGTRNTFTR